MILKFQSSIASHLTNKYQTWLETKQIAVGPSQLMCSPTPMTNTVQNLGINGLWLTLSKHSFQMLHLSTWYLWYSVFTQVVTHIKWPSSVTLNLQVFSATTRQQQSNTSQLLVHMLRALVLLPLSTSCTFDIKEQDLHYSHKRTRFCVGWGLLRKRDLFCLTIHRFHQSLPPNSLPISLYFPFLLSCFVFVGLPTTSALLPALLLALLLAGGEL